MMCMWSWFCVNCGVNSNDEGHVVYKIMIWGHYEFWAIICPISMIKK